MSISSRTLLVGIVLTILAGCSQSGADESRHGSLSGPFTHENLSVFFIHGNATDSVGDLLSLSEALKSEKIEVIETGSVGELQVENLCDEPIYIQAGDIVKGGRQDRVLQYDMVLKPRSGRVPINSFCVERGRWSARGNESAARFESSNNILASKDLKLAAKSKASQSEVWSKVAEVQSDLSDAFGGSVAAAESPTSLQLTLENDKLRERVTAAAEELTASLKKFDDVVGFAFAVNGEINSADIYGNPTLFAKMWPKLIEAAAMEAAANPNRGGSKPEVTREGIESWLASSDTGVKSNQNPGGTVNLQVTESDENMTFETRVESDSGRMIHKNVIRK